jgi:competence protein ComEC
MVSEQVSFINVGQGDAILIRSGSISVMIDTGGNVAFDLAQDVDIPYLHKEKIYHLDCLIASHSDYDHIGAGASLSEHFRVNRFVSEASEFPLTIGPLTFTNYNLWGGSEENMESLVLGLDFMGKKWLFTGDAPIAIENKILQAFPALDCDVLKVGHHGSATSSSSDFLQRITPEMAIISVGAHNHYGHPSESVLKRLDSLGIPYRRTDQEGTITYESWWGRPLGSLSA